MRSISLITALAAFTVASPSQYVNQFIGTTNGGHVFPGASLPWGSVKAGADCDSGENQAGYVSDGSAIRGFSPLHDDGTGGGPSLGQFKLLPMFCAGGLEGCDARESERKVNRVEGSNSAHPGYFSLSLQSNTTAEMTVTQHAALYRFTYSNFTSGSSTAPVLALDTTNDLSHSFSGGEETVALNGEDLRVTGSGKFRPSFGTGTYVVYFCLDIPHVASAAVWVNSAVPKTVNGTISATFNEGSQGGTLARFSDTYLASSGGTALARMGVSWTSTDKACAYAETEIPTIDDSAFTATRDAALATWDVTLGAVQLDTAGADEDLLVLFWSSLYRSYLAPTNITGDNPLWDSTEPYWDSFYCILMGLVPCCMIHPLYAITQRTAQAEVVRALIDVYRHTGFLPDCRMSLDKGFTQGGSNADSLLADSYVKGIRDGIDWVEGFAAMIKDAEVTPPDWTYEGRGGIENRKLLGYVPIDDDTPNGIKARSASRTVEYSYNDFSIALVANALGNTEKAEHYTKVSADWMNLWNANVTDNDFSGFIEPKYKNGTWRIVDPKFCSPLLNHTSCYLNDNGGEFYETSSWQYSFQVPHDMASVVRLMGGAETYVNRLDFLLNSGIHDIGNEPGFLHPYLFNYAGAPAKTVDNVLHILAANFSTEIGGLPGNDDSGAMGGFVVYSSFGFYPVAGTSVYLISTPLFKTLTFPSATPGKTAVITTVNFDGAKTNKYVQSATLNGVSFTRNWFSHGELFESGGVLELTLGSAPSDWGTRLEDLPPSISTSGSLEPFS